MNYLKQAQMSTGQKFGVVWKKVKPEIAQARCKR